MLDIPREVLIIILILIAIGAITSLAVFMSGGSFKVLENVLGFLR